MLKPLAWQGLLVQGPPREGRVTFTRPAIDLPPVDEAGPAAVLAYLGTYGPATPGAFDEWLLRGATRKAVLRGWFSELAAAGLLTEVTVEGESRWARAADADELAAARPDTSTRLLPAFDQYVVGATRRAPALLAAEHAPRVYRKAGWISPVLLVDGRMAGVWRHERKGRRLLVDIEPFDRQPKRVTAAAAAEASRLAGFLGGELTLSWSG